MASSSPSWLKLTGIGCLILMGVVLLAAVGSFVFVRIGGDRSISTQDTLDEQFLSAAEFTPLPATALSPERIESFINVRRALVIFCPQFTGYTHSYGQLEGLEQKEEDPSLGEGLANIGVAMKATFGLAGSLNKYLIIRNQALLEQQMGLGEFTWLYVLIYHSWLGHQREPFMLAQEDEPDLFEDRVVPEMRAMFARQVVALEQTVAAGRNQTASLCEEDIAPWLVESAALAADSGRIPFADGLPDPIAAVLEPYRAMIEQLFCPVTEDLDLTRTEREGIGYEHR